MPIYVSQLTLNAHLQREFLKVQITLMKTRDHWCQPEKKKQKASTWIACYTYSKLVTLHAMKPYEWTYRSAHC